MSENFLPTNLEIHDVFEEHINSLGGEVTNVYDEHGLLFMRSVLPTRQLVRPDDASMSGVALRALKGQVHVHPYVFREVCKNGAIGAIVLNTRLIERQGLYTSDEQIDDVIDSIREAVTQCADKEQFERTVSGMRMAANTPADVTLLLTLVGMDRNAGRHVKRHIDAIIKQFTREENTAYGVMNAITATARETADPEERWRLEELGGGIPALLSPVRKPSGAAAVLV